jgi:hypothetical protein
MRRRVIVAIGVLSIVMAACSAEVSFSVGGQSAEEAAVDLIEGDLADQIGLGPLDASCQDIDDLEVGDMFGCTAFVESGDVIRFVVVADAEDSIDVTSQNLILAEAVPTLEAAAVEALESGTGLSLGVENFDCGDRTVIVEEGGDVACVLTDPSNGDRYEATVTLNSREPLNIDVVVAETPLDG